MPCSSHRSAQDEAGGQPWHVLTASDDPGASDARRSADGARDQVLRHVDRADQADLAGLLLVEPAGRRYPDQLARRVDRRAAAVAVVDLGVGLEIGELVPLER